jgi:hypothetical protein
VKKLVATAALVIFLWTSSIPAQWPVIDVAAIARLVDQINWLRRQYTTMVDTYTTVVNQYNQMMINARMIASKARWRAVLTPWNFPTATNTYGTTADWMTAVTNGLNAANGYMRAVIPLQDYGAVWGTLSAASQDRISRDYATLELGDGSSVNALTTLGGIRGNARAVENAIMQLENDSLSDSPELNTEVGILNKINAATLIATRNAQDTNKLLTAVVESSLVDAKGRRDAQVQSINNDLAMRRDASSFSTQHFTGTTAVLTTYRLP